MNLCKKCKNPNNEAILRTDGRYREKEILLCNSCARRNRKSDRYLNKKFNKLFVLEQSTTQSCGTYLYRCKCDCGKETLIKGSDLKRIISCGCYRDEKVKNLNILPPFEASFNGILYQYKNRAKKIKIDFSITKEDFRNLIKMNCHYCNNPPNDHSYKTNNGSLIYNGLDRVDSTKGYILDNVVPCCAECNWMKGKSSYHDFLNRIKTIYKNLKL